MGGMRNCLQESILHTALKMPFLFLFTSWRGQTRCCVCCMYHENSQDSWKGIFCITNQLNSSSFHAGCRYGVKKSHDWALKLEKDLVVVLCSVSFTCGHYAAIWRHSTSYSGTVVSLQLSVHTPHKYQPYFSWLQWEQTAWELNSACSTVPFYQCESAAPMSSFFSAWGLTNLRRLPGLLSSRPWNFLCISQPLGDNLMLWLSVSDRWECAR